MLMKQAPDIRSSEITPERLYRNRRQFIQTASGAVAGAMAAGTVLGRYQGGVQAQEPIPDVQPSLFSTDEAQNSFEDITTYNNFYEFGLDKGDPARYAHEMTIDPWSVRVEGEMNKPAADIPLRGGLVDGCAMGRISAWGSDQAVRTHLEGEVRPVRDVASSGGNARAAWSFPPVALRRRAPDG